jgi:hypothetical protein
MRIILTAARVNVTPGYGVAAMTSDAGTPVAIARAIARGVLGL